MRLLEAPIDKGYPAETDSLSEEVEAIRISKDDRRSTRVAVVREVPLTVFLNGREIVTLLCTGAHPESLAVGFLKSEGLLQERDNLTSVEIDELQRVVRVFSSENTELAERLLGKRTITSGCGKGTMFYQALDSIQSRALETRLTIRTDQVRRLMAELNRCSELYKRSHGVHNCALADPDQIVIFRADIGRHNAVDMILGECFIHDLPTQDKILLTTGRVTSEILIKAAKMEIPMLISRSAATNLSLQLAQAMNMTVIGYVRGGRMLVYTGSGNVVD
jgi:FdhD protein